MKDSLGKAGITLVLIAATALSGCLTNGEVSETSTPSSNPPPSGNNPPTISGNPASAIRVGDNYSFTPTASDPDGDTLTFSIQNQPQWASFDPATGRLFGVAPLGAEGNYAGISISVSDGSASASTQSFTVSVTQVSLGSTTLTWTPPTQNTDGSALTDLAAYRIYYGTSPGSYPNQVLVDNPGLSTLVVDNLVPNTYYFVSTSINSQGVESDFSNVATKIVN